MEFWQEEQDSSKAYVVPDDVVDLNFRVACKQLPLDHAYLLSGAITQALPWIEREPRAAVHLIYGAESGNGWIRPRNPDDLIYPSRRTLFSLRLPKERVEAARKLDGQELQLGEYAVRLSAPTVRSLSAITTLFSRYVIADDVNDENRFMSSIAQELQERGIRVKKMLCGRAFTLRFPEKDFDVRSVMVDGLEVEQSVQLQQEGLGQGMKFGCGIFLPHKGIDPVGGGQEK